MRNGRHPLHSLCSYLGCFPPAVPRAVIGRWIAPRERVLDPFCGSGTTLLEAVLAGHPAIGVDLNPLAVSISRAKLEPVTRQEVLDRVLELAAQYPGGADTETVPDDVRTIFHPRTLAQLVYLRDALDVADPVDSFIRGMTLGIMHGKFRKGSKAGTAYLSIDMPNTFSMSPEYVRTFVRANGLTQPPVDAFGKLRERTRWLLREGAVPCDIPRAVLQGDATQLPRVLAGVGVRHVDCIVTSPPYLGVLRYGAFNWIRLWFLGKQPSEIDRMLDGTDSLDRYLSFMASFLESASRVLRPGGRAVLVIGDVHEYGTKLQLAERVWEELDGVVPFRCLGVEIDRFDETTKTTRIWGDERKGRATPLDRVLVLERVSRRSRSASGGEALRTRAGRCRAELRRS